jgi:CBS-domain-containing membrane protein
VEMGWLPLSVSRATDVGMSYGAAAVLGSLTAAIPRRWRPAWIGWFLAVGVAAVAVGRDFTDVGHAVALALGMLLATRFRRPENWTTARFVMLGVAASFGYLVLASTDLLVATAAGLAGAVIGEALTRYRVTRAPASNACEASSGHRVRSPGG